MHVTEVSNDFEVSKFMVHMKNMPNNIRNILQRIVSL